MNGDSAALSVGCLRANVCAFDSEITGIFIHVRRFSPAICRSRRDDAFVLRTAEQQARMQPVPQTHHIHNHIVAQTAPELEAGTGHRLGLEEVISLCRGQDVSMNAYADHLPQA